MFLVMSIFGESGSQSSVLAMTRRVDSSHVIQQYELVANIC